MIGSVSFAEQANKFMVAATYTSEGQTVIETLPDSRSLTVHLHYSLSELPETNYQPRAADDRIGYFLTVAKDYSRSGDQDRFTRYINRWQLEKADPSLAVSRPKKPIVFWLEKTIPHPYRDPIRAGILEWNKAFEQIGFESAIEVRQQPEDATWQPGDVRYNTFRWITSGIGVASGPSRVNRLTGQILDADITFDADFLQMWKRKYETCRSGRLYRGRTPRATDGRYFCGDFFSRPKVLYQPSTGDQQSPPRPAICLSGARHSISGQPARNTQRLPGSCLARIEPFAAAY